jgi:hypothetical protein
MWAVCVLPIDRDFAMSTTASSSYSSSVAHTQMPSVMAWTDSLHTGDARMDETHQEFVDMINEVVVQELQGPRLKLLVVDEAQDLTPLQWRMVELLAERADWVIFAGDDDQAIHRWAGVKVKLFMESSRNIEVLSQWNIRGTGADQDHWDTRYTKDYAERDLSDRGDP